MADVHSIALILSWETLAVLAKPHPSTENVYPWAKGKEKASEIHELSKLWCPASRRRRVLLQMWKRHQSQGDRRRSARWKLLRTIRCPVLRIRKRSGFETTRRHRAVRGSLDQVPQLWRPHSPQVRRDGDNLRVLRE